MKKTHNLKAVSLFSSAGIAEHYLEKIGVHVLVASELLEQRANLYKKLYPHTKMICGDILDTQIFENILTSTPQNIDFLLATPPCQGMSIAGKNRNQEQMIKDERNFLIFKIIDFIKFKQPKYILIENVPAFLKLKFELEGKKLNIVEILQYYFKDYNIEFNVYDSSDYGVAQRRKRAIIKMYKKGLFWAEPTKEKTICVKDIIGDLPSLEAGEKSNIKWHFARIHTKNHIECMKHTKTGETALNNKTFYPKDKNGKKIKAYNTTYRRIKWDEPAPTITIRNDAISSQLNVHPGRLKDDKTYSDARVLTPLELMLLSSLPKNWNVPDDTSEILIRRCLGECIPPLLIKKIVEKIGVK